MSLATRCPACGTIFRVVQDQLKVSEGWVRCGQCNEVFHGIEALFDLESDPALAARRAARRTPAPATVFAQRRAPEASLPAADLAGKPLAGGPTAPPAPEPVRAPASAPASTSAAGVPAQDPAAAIDPFASPAQAAWQAASSEGSATRIDTHALPEASAVEADPASEAPATPARQPRTILLKAPPDLDGASLIGRDLVPLPALLSAESPSDEAAPLPPANRVADDDLWYDEVEQALPSDDEDDDERAGPLTLASMLPEDAGEWPPRPRKKPRDKKPKRQKSADKPARPASTALVVVNGNDPRFLREAQRGARWSRPGPRIALGVSLAVLAIAAVGQVAYPQRDVLAARWPATLPAWQALCRAAGCTIEAPRVLASLALDGTSLTRTETDHVLLFSADLHNRADNAVRMPSFDLTFTDLNGEVVARKVLSPAQIGIPQAALAAEADLHVHARIQVADADATGFHAEMFYP